MNDSELGGVVRALRHRRGWRQADLGAEAGVSGGVVGLLERGRADRVSITAVRRIMTALGIRLEWDAGYRGAELSRLRDADHARFEEWLARRLEAVGWSVAPEVSFNHYGDRGRIDLLAYHPPTRTVLVVEVKTVVADIQGLLGNLDTKRRVAPGVARSLAWGATHVVPLLAVREGTTNRRRIATHDRLFGRFSLRGPNAMSWLRQPSVSASGIPTGVPLFFRLPDRRDIDLRRAGRQRVRHRGAARSVVKPKPMGQTRLDGA